MFIRGGHLGARSPLADRTYRHLFSAQVVSLLGTGLTTVALTLLAYDLAGDDAGAVVGIALALKMVAYVFLAPVIAGFSAQLPRRRLLVSLDITRTLIVVAMLFVTEVWQVYVLIFVLNAASAGFTPTFQAAVPDVLPDEEQYTRALSLSRLAYELENLASPALAALLLTVMSYSSLFAANAVGFLASAALVVTAKLPARRIAQVNTRSWDKVTRGTRHYLRVASLRGLLALNLAVAAASALVIVNTVIYVRDVLDRPASDVAWALGVSGAGSMLAALLLPRLLRHVSDRTALLAGGALLPVGLGLAALISGFGALLAVWFLLGIGLSVVQTPAGRLIQRAATDDDSAELFAAQFSLSHACWLLCYPLAGVLGATIGMSAIALVLAGVALTAVAVAVVLWPRQPERAPFNEVATGAAT